MSSSGDNDHKDEVKIQRCVYLIKRNRGACRRFYEYGEKMLSFHDCVKFILAVLVKLKHFTDSELKGIGGTLSWVSPSA